MPSTKKVAPLGGITKQRKSVSGVVSSRAGSVKKAISSRVSKSKKSTKKIINPQELNTSNRSKKESDTSSQNKQKKSQFRAKDTGVVNKKTDTKIEKILFKLKPETTVVPLSSSRYSTVFDKIAVQTAGYGGLLFAVLGAVSTLFFASSAFSHNTQLALLSNTSGSTIVTTATTTPPTYINCTDPLQYLSPSCAAVVDTTPPASFLVEGAPAVLLGSVKVEVVVLHAKRVRLNAYNKSTGQNVMLGLMNNTSGDNWDFFWNTQQFQDGDYALNALIDNGYGSYQDHNNSLVTVENHPLPATSTTTTSSTTTLSPVGASTTGITVTSDVQQSVDEFRFEIKTSKVDTVKMYAQLVSTGKSFFLGNAYNVNSALWRYRWISTGMQDGEYKIIAQAIASGVSNTPASVFVSKVSSLPTTATTTVLKINTALKPHVDIDIQANFPLSRTAGIKIDVENATQVELYLQNKSALTRKYLGKANSVDINTWVYYFDTTQAPNGEYTMTVAITNTFGIYEEKTPFFKIANTISSSLTTVQEEQVKTLNTLAKEINKMNVTTSTPQSRDSLISEEAEALKLVSQFSTEINVELDKMIVALRSKDQTLIHSIESNLSDIKAKLVDSADNALDKQELRESIEKLLQNKITGLIATQSAVEKIISERTKEEADTDSDNDGISNYDEVAIFKTNPFALDTDNDGFADGAEVLGGFNPLDATAEVFISYQSPKEAGIVRDDILKVNSVSSALPEIGQEQQTSKKAEAVFTGVALPNSFITLYIFSTPIVITLKTESDGSWSYRFDKEIEDGAHEVYVGITDNAGKIVAKSNSFAFVKEAQAFSPVREEGTQAPALVVSSEKSFLSEYMVYLVLSVSVVAIGLILILLGMHLDTQQRTQMKMPQEAVIEI